MLKPTETLKKFQVFGKKMQKFQVFGENWQNFKVFGKISSSGKNAKVSKFLEQTANFWKELQKYQDFG